MGKKKLTPCSLYKTEMLECWLDSMAAEGFLLEHEGYKNTYANFKEAEKQKTYHRIWPKDSLNNYKDANELRKSYGWEFVTSSFDFDIYRTTDADALRIDNDKGNYAYAEKTAKTRIIINILQTILSVAVFALIMFILPYIIVSEPSGLLMCAIGLVVFIDRIIKSIKNIFLLNKLKKRTEYKLNKENIDWKKETVSHQIPNLLTLVVWVTLFFLMLWADTYDPVRAALPDDRSNIPFATVIDFTEDKSSYQCEKKILNVFEEWKAPAANNNYEWSEYAVITDDDGNEITCRLTVDYHKTIHPLLANTVAKLYVISERLTPNSFDYFGDCPPFGFEYEKMYHNDLGDRVYVFQNGCDIIHFSLGYYTDSNIDFNENRFNEKSVEIMAESFKD